MIRSAQFHPLALVDAGNLQRMVEIVSDRHMQIEGASYRTDQTLRIGVLPGRPRGRRSVPNTQRTPASPHDTAIDAVSISHEASWRRFPRAGLAHLLRNPRGRWMRRYGMMNELSPAVCKKHQTVEQLEADRRHDEHIRGGNPRCVIA